MNYSLTMSNKPYVLPIETARKLDGIIGSMLTDLDQEGISDISLTLPQWISHSHVDCIISIKTESNGEKMPANMSELVQIMHTIEYFGWNIHDQVFRPYLAASITFIVEKSRDPNTVDKTNNYQHIHAYLRHILLYSTELDQIKDVVDIATDLSSQNRFAYTPRMIVTLVRSIRHIFNMDNFDYLIAFCLKRFDRVADKPFFIRRFAEFLEGLWPDPISIPFDVEKSKYSSELSDTKVMINKLCLRYIKKSNTYVQMIIGGLKMLPDKINMDIALNILELNGDSISKQSVVRFSAEIPYTTDGDRCKGDLAPPLFYAISKLYVENEIQNI